MLTILLLILLLSLGAITLLLALYGASRGQAATRTLQSHLEAVRVKHAGTFNTSETGEAWKPFTSVRTGNAPPYPGHTGGCAG